MECPLQVLVATRGAPMPHVPFPDSPITPTIQLKHDATIMYSLPPPSGAPLPHGFFAVASPGPRGCAPRCQRHARGGQQGSCHAQGSNVSYIPHKLPVLPSASLTPLPVLHRSQHAPLHVTLSPVAPAELQPEYRSSLEEGPGSSRSLGRLLSELLANTPAFSHSACPSPCCPAVPPHAGH